MVLPEDPMLINLSSWLQLSKSTEGRVQLIATGQLQDLCRFAAQVLPRNHDQLQAAECSNKGQLGTVLVLLRALRNACAAGSAAAEVLLQHDIPMQLSQLAVLVAQLECHHATKQQATLVAITAAGPVAAPKQTVKQQQQAGSLRKGQQQQLDHLQQFQQLPKVLVAAMQLLANTCAAHALSAAIIWKELFPNKLPIILQSQHGAVHEAVAFAALSCVRASSSSKRCPGSSSSSSSSSSNATSDTTSNTSSSSSGSALQGLVSPAAAAVWVLLLAPLLPATANSGQDAGPASKQTDKTGNDNVCLLVKAVALQYDCLPQLMECIQPSNIGSTGSTVGNAMQGNGSSSSTEHAEQLSNLSSGCCEPNQAMARLEPHVLHAVILHILAEEIEAVPPTKTAAQIAVQHASTAAASMQPDSEQQLSQQQQHKHKASQGTEDAGDSQQCYEPGGPRWLCWLVDLLRHCWTSLRKTSPWDMSNAPAAVNVLEAALQVFKALLAREDKGAGILQLTAAASTSSCAQLLHLLGLAQLLLDMLKALGPPARPWHGQQQQQPVPSTSQPTAGQQKQQQQQLPPYVGYRADLLAALSNMLYQQANIQHEVLSFGGIEVLLSNTNLDETAPLSSEWALWSIRNICENNQTVQRQIAELKAVEPIQSQELDSMGKQLELDKMTNQLRLVDKAAAS